jgi:RNA polymerase sigma-70 factor (ECF subfamily)
MRRKRLNTSTERRLPDTRGKTPREADERLEMLRRDLSPDDHTLLILRVDRQMSWEEVAQVFAGGLGAPGPATLRKRFERLGARLERKARRRGMLR